MSGPPRPKPAFVRGASLSAGAALVALLAAATVLFAGARVPQGTAQAYTLLTPDGRRALPYRSIGATDLIPLDQIASTFGLALQEDAVAGGLIITARGQRVVLTAGQALASAAGRIVSLSGPVVREGQAWFVPVDFLSRALGPALNMRIDVRRASHLIIAGDVKYPLVSGRFERQSAGGRLVLDVQPPAPHHTTREGNRLLIRFDAAGVDAGQIEGAQPEFVGIARIEGPVLAIDLGPAASTFRADDADPARLTIDFGVPAATPAPGAAPGRQGAAPEGPAVIDLSPPGLVRTVVIDPAHGGEDAGARGPAGTAEKDLTLQMARRLKAAIESRLGLRVVLTRDGDEAVPIDRRAAAANNNKADVLISLHANASFRPDLHGAEVLSLSLDDYKARARTLPPPVSVPVAGGGTRLLEAVPWDLAQIPYAARSAALSAIVVRHLGEQGVPMYAHATDQAPLRILVGANMPAVVVESGFLTNPEDERALSSGDRANAIIEALVATIVEIRGGIPTAAAGR